MVSAAILLALVPPGAAPSANDPEAKRITPTLKDIEDGARETVACTAIGEAGAIEFSLMPGVGTRVALPNNLAGIDELIVALDDERETVWLAYAGELSGKGGEHRPLGIVEQVAAGSPTVVCMTLTPGNPPVRVRLTVVDDDVAKAAHFERAATEDGWARRGRK